MNRHHPYSGYDSSGRRGGSPSGPGPERYNRFQDRGGGSHRGGRFSGGRGGGRGGYSHYDKNMSSYAGYDPGPPSNEMTGYDNFDNGYHNGPQHSGGGFNQGQGKYEGALEPKNLNIKSPMQEILSFEARGALSKRPVSLI